MLTLLEPTKKRNNPEDTAAYIQQKKRKFEELALNLTCHHVSQKRYCNEGHTFCSDCDMNEKDCPACFFDYTYLEDCQFKSDGCTEKKYEPNFQLHEKQCEFRYICCPLRDHEKCRWYDSKIRLRDHFKKRHPLNYHEGSLGIYRYFQFKTTNTSAMDIDVTFVYGMFFLVWYYFPKPFDTMYWYVSHGDKYDENKFMYQILVNGRTILTNSVSKYCNKYPVLDVFQSIPSYELFKLCNKNGDLFYKVRIVDTRKDNNEGINDKSDSEEHNDSEDYGSYVSSHTSDE